MFRPIVVVTAVLLVWAAGNAMADTMSERRWSERILLIFAAEMSAVDRQAEDLLADRPALADRDMTVFAVIGDELRPIYGTAPAGESAAELRRRFDVDPGVPITSILVGKDGTPKWRADRPVTQAEINSIVDAMPMRRAGD